MVTNESLMESVLLYLITHMTSCKREVARSLQTAIITQFWVIAKALPIYMYYNNNMTNLCACNHICLAFTGDFSILAH